MQYVNRKRRTRWRALIKADRRRRGQPDDPVQAWFEQHRTVPKSGELPEPVLLCAIAAATAWCTAPVGVADDFEFWLRRAVRHRSRRAAKPHPIAVSTIRLLNSWVSMRRTLEENGHRRLVGSLLGLLSAFADELNAFGARPVRSPQLPRKP